MITTTTAIPTFSREEVAGLLRCTDQTIKNREQRGTYPPSKRDHKNWRYYYVSDVFELMYITDKQVYIKPMVAILHDKGYTDIADLEEFLTKEYRAFQERIAVTTNPLPETDEQSKVSD